MSDIPHSAPATCYFDAELNPHRSLGEAGFRVLMGVVIAANLIVGSIFYFSGAWPIFGFMGLDVLLLYFFFRLNYRDGNLKETVRLTDDGLEVRRQHPNGEEELWSLEPYWLRIDMDDPPKHDSRLVLQARGRRVVIGSFLTPDERLEVARALRRALHKQRHREFVAVSPTPG